MKNDLMPLKMAQTNRLCTAAAEWCETCGHGTENCFAKGVGSRLAATQQGRSSTRQFVPVPPAPQRLTYHLTNLYLTLLFPKFHYFATRPLLTSHRRQRPDVKTRLECEAATVQNKLHSGSENNELSL